MIQQNLDKTCSAKSLTSKEKRTYSGKSLSLTVSLLGTGLGNPNAFADDTESSQSKFLQVWPVVVVNHLVSNSLRHPGEFLLEDRLVDRDLRLVLLLGLGGSEDNTLFLVSWLDGHCLLVCKTRVLVGVKVAEVVLLFAELNLSVASSELFDQETVVALNDLPDQLSWNCRHFQPVKFRRERE